MDSPDVHVIFQAVRQGLIGNLRRVLGGKNGVMENLCECNERKETPLHVAIRERKFEVIEFLVQSFKDNIQIDCHPQSKFYRQMSPFSWDTTDFETFSIGPAELGKEFTQTFVLPSSDVAIIRDIANQINIFKLIEHLIDIVNDETSWFEFVLNSIVTSTMARPEKIIALELMGAAFILKILLGQHFELDEIAGGLRGIECWKKALQLRNSTVNGRSLIPKIPYVLTSAARKAFGDSAEVTTSLQLEELENQLRNHDHRSPIIDQAFLVIQRTFAQSGQTEPNLFHLKTLLDYGKQFQTTGDHVLFTEIHYSRAINISLMIMQHFKPTDSPKSFQVYVEAFLLMANVFIRLEHNPSNNAERIKELTFVQLIEAIKFGIMIATSLLLLRPISSQHEMWKLLVTRKMYLLLFALFRMRRLVPEEMGQLCQILENFVRIEKLRNRFSSLLHLAIEGFVSTRFNISIREKIIRLLLDSGADPKIVDRNGKSPHHLLAENCQPNSTKTFFDIFQAVLEAGSHLDQATPDGKTVLTIMRNKKKLFVDNQTLDPRVDFWINTVMPLECFCAQKIMQENIAFEDEEHRLPLCLQQFIEEHSSLKGEH